MAAPNGGSCRNQVQRRDAIGFVFPAPQASSRVVIDWAISCDGPRMSCVHGHVEVAKMCGVRGQWWLGLQQSDPLSVDEVVRRARTVDARLRTS